MKIRVFRDWDDLMWWVRLDASWANSTVGRRCRELGRIVLGPR